MKLLDYSTTYIERVCALLKSIKSEELESFLNELVEATKNEARIFFIGNGGSASTCSHFANDFSRCEIGGNPVRAISLCENTSLITAIANDFGYENIFKLQLKRELGPNDLVVAVSVSGNSKNLVEAIEYSKNHGNKTFALLGSDGGELSELVEEKLLIHSGGDEFGPVEDIHLILNHLLSTFIRKNYT